MIAHVLHRLYVAGAEVLAADLARQLRGREGGRFNSVFFCLDEVGPLGEQLRGEGFEVFDLKRRPGVNLSVARKIRGLASELGVGLLHAHQYTPFFYAAASRGPRGLFGGPPVLFTEHGRHYPDVRKTKRVVANKFLLARRDRVTAVGDFVKRALIDNEGLPAQRIEVIHNGIDPARFDVPTSGGPGSTRAAMRAELGLHEQDVAILQVARFHSVKDHQTAIRAFALALRQLETRNPKPETRLLLAGDGARRAEIERLAVELNIAARVHFLGVRNDVPRLMAGADMFVLSSLSEGISVTLLEAMGCRLPIAATDVGGNGEVVAAGQTGLLSPRQDPDALAANLVTLILDPALRRRMGDAGRERLLGHFTQQNMHDRYAVVYEQMLGV